MKTLLLATHNQGKAKEFATLLHGLVEEVKSAADFNLPEPEETETTFTGNALLKARAGCAATGLPTLADDSGFAVDALNGDPGVYSARWAGPDKNFQMAMEKVNDRLEDTADRGAAFIAVLALVYPDGREITFEGRCEGQAVWPPRGDGGFGYDPMFQPDGFDQTFGEMTADQKHAISHRAKAVTKLKHYLSS
jgi:XTP/dITP diphosphohydrolase